FAIAGVRVEQRQNLVAQRREIIVLRCAEDQELVAPDSVVDALHLVDDDRRRIVFAELQAADDDYGQLILRHTSVLTIALRPQNTLRTAGLVFQTEERELVTFLGGADLQVSDDPARRDANAAVQLGQLRRLHRLHVLENVKVTLERMTRNIKAQRRFL